MICYARPGSADLAVQHDGILVIQVSPQVVYEPWGHSADQTKALGGISRGQLEEGACDARCQRHKVNAKVVCSPTVVTVLIPAHQLKHFSMLG